MDSEPVDPAVHALAIRLARQCRHIIQAVLREEEWNQADLEFYNVILQGLEQRGGQDRSNPPASR